MNQTSAQPARNRLAQIIMAKFKRTPLLIAQPDPPGSGAPKWEHLDITLPIDKEQIRKQAQEWLKPELCPPAVWYSTTAKVPEGTAYESYFKTQLRLRYVELADLFRASIGNHYDENTFDVYAARSIAEMLQMTARALGESDPDLLGIASRLESVNRYLIWLYPASTVTVMLRTTQANLVALNIPGTDRYMQELAPWVSKSPDPANDLVGYNRMRTSLDEVQGAINEEVLSRQISTLLQVRRLRRLMHGGVLVLLVFWLCSPLVINPSLLAEPINAQTPPNTIWPVQVIGMPDALTNLFGSGLLRGWLTTIGIALIGMAGGFVSGFLQARQTRILLPDYEVDKLKLRLKLLGGALLALVVFVLLSWQVMPGITIINTGSYFLIAFLTGFSERYFLKLLEMNADGAQGPKSPTAAPPPPPKPDGGGP